MAHDIIVIGASAGGVEALIRLTRRLPNDLSAAVFIVLHVPAGGGSMLPAILGRGTSLRATHAEDGEKIEHGRIYIAPPDRHLMVHQAGVEVAMGPKVNSVRPAIDPLFRSAAGAFGPRVAGVILSGTLDDGVAGMGLIRHHGGITMVQDLEDALHPSLPGNVLKSMAVDHTASAGDLGALLGGLAKKDASVVEMENHLRKAQRPPEDWSGALTVFRCPDCGGPIRETSEGSMDGFRCRIGHAYSPVTFFQRQGEELERALWTAYETLKERADLGRLMEARSRTAGQRGVADRYAARAKQADEQAKTLRKALDHLHAETPESEVADG